MHDNASSGLCKSYQQTIVVSNQELLASMIEFPDSDVNKVSRFVASLSYTYSHAASSLHIRHSLLQL
jgi:hypothetical protein